MNLKATETDNKRETKQMYEINEVYTIVVSGGNWLGRVITDSPDTLFMEWVAVMIPNEKGIRPFPLDMCGHQKTFMIQKASITAHWKTMGEIYEIYSQYVEKVTSMPMAREVVEPEIVPELNQ